MAASARDRMVDSAIKLLATDGFQGASFSSILEDSGAPRGSIYHHFPGGKDELVVAAVDRAGEQAIAAVDSLRGRPAEEVVGAFVATWRALLTVSNFRIGCSLVGVTVSAEDRAVVDRAAEVFRTWRTHLAAVLVAGGVEAVRGEDVATLVLAACEGAVVICRAERSLGPLDRVEASLREAVAGRRPRVQRHRHER
jgi:TetR/AcrR family transcriptional regulator, lmrAB and yxaGH operons repressor